MDLREKAGAAGLGFGKLIVAVIKLGYYVTVTLAMIKYLKSA